MSLFFVVCLFFTVEANAALDDRAQVIISVADSVIQGQPFYVDIELADLEGNRLTESQYGLELSADKPDIAMPSKLLLKNGRAGFWAIGRSWKGNGLHFNASIDMGNGPHLSGRSISISMLAGGTAPLGQPSQIFLSAPDSVRQGEQFYVHAQLVDRKGRQHRGTYSFDLSADKPDIELPWGDLSIDGGRSFAVKSSAWHGDDLRFNGSVALDDGTTISGISNAAVVWAAEVDTLRELSQIFLSAPDTVRQGEQFWVGVKLKDRAGRPFLDGQTIAVSADKLGITMPTGDQTGLNGEGGFWARSASWHGEGLHFDVRITRHDGSQISGRSSAIVALPEENN